MVELEINLNLSEIWNISKARFRFIVKESTTKMVFHPFIIKKITKKIYSFKRKEHLSLIIQVFSVAERHTAKDCWMCYIGEDNSWSTDLKAIIVDPLYLWVWVIAWTVIMLITVWNILLVWPYIEIYTIPNIIENYQSQWIFFLPSSKYLLFTSSWQPPYPHHHPITLWFVWPPPPIYLGTHFFLADLNHPS